MSSFAQWIKRYPVVRGMITYSLLWPTGCLIQQKISGKKLDELDWKKCWRFFFYGGFIVAPSLYCWIRVASIMWPNQNLKSAIAKVGALQYAGTHTTIRDWLIGALTEQISYTPMAMTAFYFSMSLLESKTVEESLNEVRVKVFPTYKVQFYDFKHKVALCIWPFIQTFNFSVVPEKNRVPFVSMCSLLWTIFLAYMKEKELKELEAGIFVKK
uniref:Mpv17-like protein n=1 Tax=Anopheles christyi TaxID=43041 RepID=A0A182JSM5_9DIPT